jgi:NAD+ synthase (glutamine-hydrolysing)
VTPELSLTGYPPEDLLLRRAFYAACDSALHRLAGQLLQYPELAVVVGHPMAREGQRFNAASVLHGGRVQGTYCKHDLPNYDVFDEQRYFTPDNRSFVFDVKGTMFGITICEDTWFHYAPECARRPARRCCWCRHAPFHLGKQEQRLQTMRSNVRTSAWRGVRQPCRRPDELVFDGLLCAGRRRRALVTRRRTRGNC